MTEYISGSLGKCLKMCLYISKQQIEMAALMIVPDHPPRDPPQPFDTVCIGIIGRCVYQEEVVLQFGKHAAHEQRTSRGVRLQVVGQHDGDAPASLRAGNRSTHLFTEYISRPSRSDSAVEPALAPVNQTKTVGLAVVSWGLDQPLPTSTPQRPDPVLATWHIRS